jgi:hypothetical protein
MKLMRRLRRRVAERPPLRTRSKAMVWLLGFWQAAG